MSSALEQRLTELLPEGCAPQIVEWLSEHRVGLRITRSRRSKLGDYRRVPGKQEHQISINGDLNRYSFLITLVHEIAHMHAFLRYGNRIKPHGKEWKSEFQRLMIYFERPGIFPPDVASAVSAYMANPGASSCSDPNLYRVLSTYDPPSGKVPLEELPHNALFTLDGKRVFVKKERLRTRFRCEELNSRRAYRVSAFAEVIHLVEGKKE